MAWDDWKCYWSQLWSSWSLHSAARDSAAQFDINTLHRSYCTWTKLKNRRWSWPSTRRSQKTRYTSWTHSCIILFESLAWVCGNSSTPCYQSRGSKQQNSRHAATITTHLDDTWKVTEVEHVVWLQWRGQKIADGSLVYCSSWLHDNLHREPWTKWCPLDQTDDEVSGDLSESSNARVKALS